MTAPVPTDIPVEIIAGDTLDFKRSIADYKPADGWTATYSLVQSGARIQFAGSDNGDGTHRFTVAATTTDDWTAGRYAWQLAVEKAGVRHTVERGTATIVADFAGAGASAGLDARAHAEKVLDALEATIAGKASRDQLSYSIGDRSISRMGPGELREWRDFYRSEVRTLRQKERRARGQSTGASVRVRFTR